MADKETTPSRAGGTRQAPPRRSDVIRCENCGEEYSVTYKRCPFCDERPGRPSRPGGRSSGGRRVANNKRGGGYGGPVNPIHVIWLVISLVVIIAAAVIVIRFVGGPLLGGGDSSAADPGSSQTDSSQPGGDGGQVQGPAAESITLSRTDFTLQYDEPYQLTATVTPADVGEPVEWTSSDPSILTVDANGLIRNVNTGTELQRVVVTATCGGVQAQCEVYCRAQNAGGSDDPAPSGGSQGGGTATAGSEGTINAPGGLYIRSGPGSEYEVLASAPNGATVTILGVENGWYRIEYSPGHEGYVSGDYVTVSG